MIVDRNRIYDGFDSLEQGVDAGRHASLIGSNQVVSAENMVFRGGSIKPRPGFRRLTEDFTNPDNSYYSDGSYAGDGVFVPDQTASTVYAHGKFQSAHVYNPRGGQDCIMAMIGGRLFKIIPRVTRSQVTEVTMTQRNRADLPIAYMVQADKWLVVQDGDSKPILYNGGIARRANSDATDPEKSEVPIGTIMAYGMGRLVVIVNRRNVAFGDLFGSHELPDPGDSIILFTERNFLAEGFDAQIPFEQGVATGAVFFPQLDTSTGNGQLMVFATRGASSFFLSLPREQWKTSQFQIHALKTTGMRGHRAIAAANEDLWFRSDDGYRSYRQARSESTGWAHIPQSTNVKQFMDADTKYLLKYGSVIYFDNRVIGTCSPVWNRGRPYHEGLVEVDFDIISAFGQTARPAWDGNWTVGRRRRINLPEVKVLQVLTGEFNGVQRAFLFGMDENNKNGLYEFSYNDPDDWGFRHIEWNFITRSFDFSRQPQQGSSPYNECELYDGDIWLREIVE